MTVVDIARQRLYSQRIAQVKFTHPGEVVSLARCDAGTGLCQCPVGGGAAL